MKTLDLDVLDEIKTKETNISFSPLLFFNELNAINK